MSPKVCLLCGCSQIRSLWDKMPSGIRTVQCLSCGLVYQPDPGDVASIYGDQYHAHWSEPGVTHAKRATYRYILGKVPWPKTKKPRILDVGCALGDSLEAIEQMGGDPWGLEYAGALEENLKTRWGSHVVIGDFLSVPLTEASFYALGMIDVIEHFTAPVEVLQRCWRLLEPGGWLFLATPDYGSISRMILRKHWEQFKPEHISYFRFDNLAAALQRIGFRVQHGGNFRKKLHIGYLLTTLSHHSPWIVSNSVVGWVKRWPWLWNRQVWLPTDGFILLAQKPS